MPLVPLVTNLSQIYPLYFYTLQHTSLKELSSYTPLQSLQVNSFILIFQNKFRVHFLSLLCVPHTEYKLRSSSVCISLRPSATSCTFGPNIFLSCPLKAPKFTSLFFHKIRDQANSHVYTEYSRGCRRDASVDRATNQTKQQFVLIA